MKSLSGTAGYDMRRRLTSMRVDAAQEERNGR